jgi:hypothetical protein
VSFACGVIYFVSFGFAVIYFQCHLPAVSFACGVIWLRRHLLHVINGHYAARQMTLFQ